MERPVSPGTQSRCVDSVLGRFICRCQRPLWLLSDKGTEYCELGASQIHERPEEWALDHHHKADLLRKHSFGHCQEV